MEEQLIEDMSTEERKAEMVRLRFEERKSLREIGALFGRTRERVRQIIGNTGHGIVPKMEGSSVERHREYSRMDYQRRKTGGKQRKCFICGKKAVNFTSRCRKHRREYDRERNKRKRIVQEIENGSNDRR